VRAADFPTLTADTIAARVRQGSTTPTEIVRASFARARGVGAGRDELNIILWSDEEAAIKEAETLSSQIAGASKGGRLAGVPIAVKDNIATLARLDFDAGELAEIDRYATESDINLWASSSQS